MVLDGRVLGGRRGVSESGQRTAGVHRVAVCRNVATVNVSGSLQERGASSKSSELEDAGRVSSKSERQPATLQNEQQQ